MKSPLWFVVALVGVAVAVGVAAGAIVAGVGGGGKSASSRKTIVTVVTTAPQTTSTAQEAGTSTGPDTSAPSTVTACAGAIQAHAVLSASAVAKLEGICRRIAAGDQAERATAEKEACLELVNHLHIPAGPARERALTRCHAPTLK